jgi:hypothetical protein
VLGLSLLAAGLGAQMFTKPELPGVAFVHRNSPTARKHLLAAMGGGVGLLDYNNDGLLDVFFVNGGEIAEDQSEAFGRKNPANWDRLYRQNRDGSFTDVTEPAGLGRRSDGDYGMGVATGDYDNDGFTDLYITNYGHNVLFHNNGDGTFTDVTEKAGVAGGGWSASAGFFDYDNDGKLDLFVTRYLEWSMNANKACPVLGLLMYCPPGEFPPTRSILYHNRGDGTFEDVSAGSGIAAAKGRGLGVAFADYDADGFTDIFVANDGMEQFLFHNNHDGTFTERGLEAGAALSDSGQPFSGMGVDFRDFDDDGRPDIIVTNLGRQNYALYRNEGGGRFSYATLSSGLGTISAVDSGWGVGFRDVSNEGRKALLVAQSHVMDNIAEVDPNLHYAEAPLLALNRGGRFEKIDSGDAEPVAGRGLAFGDIDNDGWMDAVLTVLGGRPVYLHNRGGTNNWLTVSLRGTRSNRDGFGAVVRCNGQTEFATASGSYLSASDKRIHFGLAKAQTAMLEILWPSGIHQQMRVTGVNRSIEVVESR